jgi:hypothetical protein
MKNFGFDGDAAVTLLINSALLHNLKEFSVTNHSNNAGYLLPVTKGRGKIATFLRKNGRNPLATSGWTESGDFIIAPYSFSLDGVPLDTRAIEIPADTTLTFSAKKGEIKSLGTPAKLGGGFLVPEEHLPAFNLQNVGTLISSTLIDIED